MLGNWDVAIADFQKAAELAPQYAFARANYALAQYQIGQTDEAVRTMRNLVRKYPKFADMRAALTAALWVQAKPKVSGCLRSDSIAAIKTSTGLKQLVAGRLKLPLRWRNS